MPLGYKLIEGKKGYLEIDDESAEVVRESFRTFLSEGTLANAAKSLNARGFRPRRHMQGGGRHQRLGVFSVDTLWSLLRNKVYLGIKRFSVKGEEREVKAVWEPLIDEMTFKRVQKILHKNFRSKKPAGWKKMPYLLSGRIRCGTCGEALCGKTATGATKKVPYYEHGLAIKRQSGLSKKFFGCKPIRFSAEKAEAMVWAKIEELLAKPEYAKQLVEQARKEFSGSKYLDEAKRLKSRITGYTGQIEALTERLSQLPKTVSATSFFNQMEKLEELKRQDEDLLAKAKAKQQRDEPIDYRDYRSLLAQLVAVREKLGSEAKAKIIESLIHKVELFPDRISIHFYVGQSLLQGELLSKEGGSPFLLVKAGNGSPRKRKSLNQIRALRPNFKLQSNRQVGSSNTIDYGDSGLDRTGDLVFRKHLLYPTELRSRCGG